MKNPVSPLNPRAPVQTLTTVSLYGMVEKNDRSCKIQKGILCFPWKAHSVLQSEEGGCSFIPSPDIFLLIYCSDLVALIPGSSSESPMKHKSPPPPMPSHLSIFHLYFDWIGLSWRTGTSGFDFPGLFLRSQRVLVVV